jgi:hypothetical protein
MTIGVEQPVNREMRVIKKGSVDILFNIMFVAAFNQTQTMRLTQDDIEGKAIHIALITFYSHYQLHESLCKIKI